MKRLASSRPSSLNSSSPWSIARRIVGGAALSPDAPACAMSRKAAKSWASPSSVFSMKSWISTRLRGRPRWRTPSAKRGSLTVSIERLGKPVFARYRRPLGPDDRQRQPRQVVALQARPKACAQEGRLARSRRAEDDEHARDACAREPADLVEPAHDLRVAAEKDRRVLLLKIGEAGIWGAVGVEGEGRRVEAGALQSLLEAPVGLRVAGKVDELFVGEVERNQRPCRRRRAPR